VTAMLLIRDVRGQLARLEEEAWVPLVEECIRFCEEHNLNNVPAMGELWEPPHPRTLGRPPLGLGRTNDAYYKEKIFRPIVQQLCAELDSRFDDEGIEIMHPSFPPITLARLFQKTCSALPPCTVTTFQTCLTLSENSGA
jgi:hypothetical protein